METQSKKNEKTDPFEYFNECVKGMYSEQDYAILQKSLQTKSVYHIGKDPVRYPKVQLVYEKEFCRNYDSMLKVMQLEISQILKNQ
jgi:hypothetical protein